MRFKAGVNLELAPEMAKALPAIDAASFEVVEQEAWITSGRDGQHMQGSLHSKGRAVDLRTKYYAVATVALLAAALRRHLNGTENVNRPYQVVIEKDHMHIEWQPQPGV